MARLVLVDDHEIVRAGIRKALEANPDLKIVAELGDGATLIDWLQSHVVDLLLIDLTMPNFNPIRDIQHIHETYPTMKILVVSAYDDDVYVKGLLSIGVDGYHLKDQPLSDLTLAVQRILNDEKWISSRLVQQLATPTKPSAHETFSLTDRQRDILRLLSAGLDNRSIANELHLSVKTIENHLTRLYKELNVHSRLEAVNLVSQHPELLAVAGATMSDIPLTSRNHIDKGTILIVDDNARYRQQLMRMVGTISPQSLIYDAENIEGAMLFAQRIQPKLALVDMVLGDESGLHCLQHIRRLSPKTRVILFSAYPDSEFHRRGLQAGAVAFVDKKNLDTVALRQILVDMDLA